MKISLFALAAASAVFISGAAYAADLAMPGPAATAWDGLYIGGTVGYGWGTASDQAATASPTGGLVGAQAGYNAHIADSIVAGIQANVDWNGENATFPSGNKLALNWDAAITGRLGYDMGSGLLPYVEAGVAWTGPTGTPVVGGTVTNTYVGWTAGAGLEYMFTSQLSANIEYRYSNYGTQNYGPFAVALSDSQIRLGLNYHF